jgi:hypothetical protein
MIPLGESEKTDVRRFCGYPAYGAAPVGFQTWRFYQIFGLLEFRLNNLSASELSVIRRYISTLTTLEEAIPHAGDNMDTDQAAVWTHNKNEVGDRSGLFDDWCRRLCGFLGIPSGPYLGIPSITLVV